MLSDVFSILPWKHWFTNLGPPAPRSSCQHSNSRYFSSSFILLFFFISLSLPFFFFLQLTAFAETSTPSVAPELQEILRDTSAWNYISRSIFFLPFFLFLFLSFFIFFIFVFTLMCNLHIWRRWSSSSACWCKQDRLYLARFRASPCLGHSRSIFNVKRKTSYYSPFFFILFLFLLFSPSPFFFSSFI